ncbi:glycosyltransferase family 1 protein [Hymenobacter oligotrophus]|uniref:Glycosyltransferase family 1 protein n=1 Tax=Hymenobacter oligotrophus TaxID=2319843 RepID=A0A3B7QZ37_9BACT|nr:glycosyltransferase family 1 protein [Hymenobacter oligotrophus]AYA36875.1 glycosyltransferase family 1 protein [Hymenobacter oligotrophus]
MKTKVLFDHQIFTVQNYGGVSRYFCELMRHAGPGLQCELPVVLSNNLYLRNRQYTNHRTFFPNTNLPGGWRIMRACNDWAARKALRRGAFDVFHPTLFDDDYFLERMPAGKPFVITIHDMIPYLYPAYYPGRELSHLKRVAERASRIITVSENTRADALRLLRLPPERVVVIPHGTTTTEATGPAPRVPGRYVLYTGTRGMYKNFGCFAEAASLLRRQYPELYFVCAGGGPFSPAEQEQLRALQLTDRMVQLGPLTDAELAYLYRGAAAFVFPSHYEGFGLPILEAFAHGCPVVLSEASCFPEVAQEAALYFRPEAPQQLAEQLAHVLSDKALKQRLSAAGRLRSQDFTWERTADLTRQLYKDAVTEPLVLELT